MLCAMGGGGGPGKDHELAMSSLRDQEIEPQRWDRGSWVRLGLAFTPLVVILIIGIIFFR
jgi:hypothetical protein